MEMIGNTRKQPCTIAVTVLTRTPKKFYLTVSDVAHPDTFYTKRFATITGQETMYVRMPVSPEKVKIKIISEVELSANVKDPDYRVKIEKRPLKRKLDAFEQFNPTIASFVRFAQAFSQRASYISARDSVYTSDDGKFTINYVDQIKGSETPARISRETSVIEVSKAKFITYTVPMRMAIMLHEFAHYYLNEDMGNEIEADCNALLIYLGLGYPRVEAYRVFTKVFDTAPTELNKERMGIIDKFIREFEKRYTSMAYDRNQLSRMERQTKRQAA